MNADTIRQALLNLLHSLFPELRDRTHLPHKARVLAVHGEAGPLSPDGPRRYSVDVQPLHPDGTDDDSRAPIHDVPLEVAWTGPEGRGVYGLPDVGSIVLIGYIGGSPSYPYVDRVLADGHDVPDLAPGEYLIRQQGGVTIRIAPDGTVEITSTVKIVVDAPEVEIAGGGPAVGRVGDEVEVYVLSGSSAGTWKGKITQGSPKVTSG